MLLLSEGSCVSIIIPAYNEENRIQETIRTIQSISFPHEIIVVDDGSTDSTRQKVKALTDVSCISLSQNLGKGAALKIGLNHCHGNVVAFFDGDLSSHQKQIEEIIRPVLDQSADLVIGRIRGSGPGGFGFVTLLAYFGVYILTGEKIMSVLSGQRAMSKCLAQSIISNESGFGVEVGSTIEAIRLGARIKEVCVDMMHRKTTRDLKGFFHRGRQFVHIFITLISKIL